MFGYFLLYLLYVVFLFFKQKTAYEMRISDWSSDVCSSDLQAREEATEWAQYGELDPETEVQGGAVRASAGLLRRLAGETADSEPEAGQIGRASCRERVGQYV